MPKLDEPLRDQEVFIFSLFTTIQIWVLWVNLFCSFWLIFFPIDPDAAYFCGSGSRKPKSCGSNGSGNNSTAAQKLFK